MKDIAAGVRSFTLGTAVSRVLGLGRELVFAILFGASGSMDAFVAAFRIPNLLRDLFAENALSAAFVPVLVQQKEKGRDAANRFASNILNTLLLVVGLIVLIGIPLSSWLARVIAPEFGNIPGKLALTGKLTAIMFPFLLFIALAAWAMSILNTEGSFFIPSIAPAFWNVFSILVPLAMFAYFKSRGVDPIFGAAIGVTVGGLIQFAAQLPSVRRHGFRYVPTLSFRDPEFRKVMALFIPVAVGLSGSRINVFVNTILVTSLPEGSLSWLNYAYRIMHLPLGLFGMAVMAVSLPSFSRLAAENRPDDMRRALDDSLKMVLLLTVPTSALIAALARPITSVLYEHGSRFTAADTAPTAVALALYMLGVPFISALRNVAAVFYAHRDARTPLIASFAGVGLNIVLNLALKGPLGLRAFPLSASIAAVVNILILYAWLPKKIGRFDRRPLASYSARLLLASLAGGAAAWGAFRALASAAESSFVVKLTGAAGCGLAGLLVFVIASRLLGLTEVRAYAKRFLRF
jgi:putative peptidoglycan lipid II flippase